MKETKNNIKSSLRETKKSCNRFNLLTANNVKNRHTGKSGRLKSIIEITKIKS